jgi:hypothetical protein
MLVGLPDPEVPMRSLAVFVIPFAFAVGFWALRAPQAPVARAADKAPATEVAPVEVSMHDFMESVFQSPYRRLKAALAAEPKDAAAWKAVRSDALILAEGGNLLLVRKPMKDSDEWAKHSAASRDAGAALFKAAKAKDYPATKKAYEAMLGHCNACHKKFEDGQHMLAP